MEVVIGTRMLWSDGKQGSENAVCRVHDGNAQYLNTDHVHLTIVSVPRASRSSQGTVARGRGDGM